MKAGRVIPGMNRSTRFFSTQEDFFDPGTIGSWLPAQRHIGFNHPLGFMQISACILHIQSNRVNLVPLRPCEAFSGLIARLASPFNPE